MKKKTCTEINMKDNYQNINWQQEFRKNIRTIADLKKHIHLSNEEEKKIQKVIRYQALNIPVYYLNLINWDNENDQIKKIVWPSINELQQSNDIKETIDPYGDDKHYKGNGIIHKYQYSVLILATEQCFSHCRYCFRKTLVGNPNNKKIVKSFEKVAEYISDHKEINNVIISGGDPGTLATTILKRIFEILIKIENIDFIRFGTKSLVNFPVRYLDSNLIELFKKINKRKPLYIPTHFNNYREITSLSNEAIQRVRKAGVIVNNQSVLLKGVNDSAAELITLMNGLVKIGVNPYYLYQCMPVTKVSKYFQVPLIKGIDIVSEAKKSLNGYAKRFKFIMAHDSGKIEICGKFEDNIIMSQLHSRLDNPNDASKIIVRKLTKNVGWYDDLFEKL